MRSRTGLSIALILCVSTFAACTHATKAHATYGLGELADPVMIRRLDIDVAPDGKGLPDGRGDAIAGAPVYVRSCAMCHGNAIRLDRTRWPYATTLFDYIRRAMPPDRTHALSAGDVYAVTAYELTANGLIEPTRTIDRSNLAQITMPGKKAFEEHP